MISGCLQQTQKPASSWLERHQIPTSLKSGPLIVCQNVGCSQTVAVELQEAQWQQVEALFTPPATSPAEERNRIALAIGLLEKQIGPLANTAHDEGGNTLFPSGPGFQLDCIAETTNSTRYLLLFYQHQLLHWHRPAYPAHRGPLQLTGPHFSAVIEELQSGQRWAVDSWFFDNGQPASIIPLPQWRSGYSPES